MKTEPPLYFLLRPCMAFLFFLLYHPSFEGKKNILKRGSIVLAGNHTCSLDFLLLICATRRCVHFLAKDELFKGPFKLFFRSLGAIPVNRRGRDTHALRAAVGVLRKGRTIGIFPEGRVNKTSEPLLPLKSGAVKMAQITGAKIIPFTISGRFRIFRRGPLITFHEPMEIESTDLAGAKERLAQIIGSGLGNRSKPKKEE